MQYITHMYTERQRDREERETERHGKTHLCALFPQTVCTQDEPVLRPAWLTHAQKHTYTHN